MTFATLADLPISLLRPLTANEAHYAPSLLERAEALLIALVPDLIERATDPDYRAQVISIEADMLARVFRNPDGLLSETEGLYTYRLDKAVASGRLAPSDAELDALGRRARLNTGLGELDGYARRRCTSTGSCSFLRGG
ncbi:MAG: hypothetical protein JWR04_3148 [Rhodoglobus sp.]|nr:hypothetical protein [Rhodoglobus sp.]